jgi:hypothetical protein
MTLRKSLLAIAAILLASPSAFATKAKIQSLQGARFLTDSQFVFENPGQLNHLKNYLTFELGGTGAASNPKSEGGIYKDMGAGKAGLYLGHMSADQLEFRAVNGFLTEENPVELFYASGNWGASLGYSQSDKGTTDEEQSSIVGRFGFDGVTWEAWINAEVISKADKVNDEYKGSPIVTIGGEYHISDAYYVDGSFKVGKIEDKIAGVTTDTDTMQAEVTFLDRSIKTDKATIYYGPGLRWNQTEVGNAKKKDYELPVYIGMEYTANSWLVVRGSVSQNFILGQTKDETVAAPGNKSDTIANNTTVSTGIGIVWDALTVDATVAGSTTGQFNGNSILANLGMIYNF